MSKLVVDNEVKVTLRIVDDGESHPPLVIGSSTYSVVGDTEVDMRYPGVADMIDLLHAMSEQMDSLMANINLRKGSLSELFARDLSRQVQRWVENGKKDV